ncbi:hypothetical protein CALCODRAFT_260912 [Calocera cornea HHB12733]|uniref:Uncharacterized protein n=1 Tax=Calocera cornea HHB12733 TaxID=1353952 RepID=A0A165GIW0_9BASI|nr:hypothetical protein CALCODRAFT_260912 [Calocera cornea HHB12733]
MFYCPRPGCHKWWHEACLEQQNYSIRDRNLSNFEEEWEKSFDEERLADIKTEVRNLSPGESTDIPPRLAAYARRPIMKGGRYGVNGNVATTLRARWLIHQARKGVAIPDKFKDYCKYKRRARIEGGARSKERVRRSTMPHFEPEKQGPFFYCFFCPACKKTI